MSPEKPGKRGPDRNKTAPRTRFSKRIYYRVWSNPATKAAREIFGLFGKGKKHCTLHTYKGHDGDPRGAMAKGISWSVDFYITSYGHNPTAEQLAVGQQMVNYACRNWNRLNLDKIIWKGYYTRDGSNWYRYKWWTFNYDWGGARKVTKDHRDHAHMRFGNW